MLDFAQHLLLAISQLTGSTGGKAQWLGGSQPLRPRVTGHNNDRVTEVHRAPLSVRQAPILHNLQQQIKDIGVSLFNFVQQHHAVGLTANGIRQLSTLIVAHIARGRTDQASCGVLFHVLAHIKAQHGSFVPKQLLGQGLGQLGLAHAGGSQKEEGAYRTVFILKAGPRPAYRLADSLHGLILTNNALTQASIQLQQLGAFTFCKLSQRDPRPSSNHLCHILAAHRHGLRGLH